MLPVDQRCFSVISAVLQSEIRSEISFDSWMTLESINSKPIPNLLKHIYSVEEIMFPMAHSLSLILGITISPYD